MSGSCQTDGMTRKYQPGEIIDGVPYQERIERFCGHFVESGGNRMQAYRLAFVVTPDMANSLVFKRANDLLADPEVLQRVNEMRETAAAATLLSVTQLMQDWADIATADPNELVSYMRTACRHCHGIGHAYQWRTEAEYVATAARSEKLLDISGGMGYDEYADPHPACPQCRGKGEGHPYIHDTRNLTTQARKLYAGIKQTKDGVQVLMHDQNRARENLARCFGAFKDAVPQTQAPAKAVPLPTPEDAQRAYLQVIQGGR